MIKTFGNNCLVVTGVKDIARYRMCVLLNALKLEVLGMKVTRGSTAYAVIKKEYGLRGSKQKVFDQFKAMIHPT